MKTYTIARADADVPLTGDVEGPWTAADVASIDEFNWYESGPRPETTVRGLYDDTSLSLQFLVEDDEIASRTTELNGPTYEDSCVEFFATPDPGSNARYLNFEANPCGVFKMAWMEPGWSVRGIGRDLVSPELAEAITVATSEPGPTREPSADDESWWLAVRFPFEALSAFTGLDLAPGSGDRWRANFHRTGVASRSQEASWNPIGTAEKQFHSPGHFGWVDFE
ncbi:carbohydrate-binding family 9-like protein [Halosimplex amylolyticum]|uniref:carbohydrate-binding family 9-like protein n=1 Tax=Halosimplex amylolyticum TaxID=3396616 RepID=UPI003F566869